MILCNSYNFVFRIPVFIEIVLSPRKKRYCTLSVQHLLMYIFVGFRRYSFCRNKIVVPVFIRLKMSYNRNYMM